jgi:hypothetical protein
MRGETFSRDRKASCRALRVPIKSMHELWHKGGLGSIITMRPQFVRMKANLIPPKIKPVAVVEERQDLA